MLKRIFVLLVSLICFSSPVFAADAVYLLNSAPLIPTSTGFTPCDGLVQNTLAQITNDQMTTYDKVRACYDYLIENCSYGRQSKSYNIYNNYLIFDNRKIPVRSFSKIEGPLRAYEMLRYRVGVCDDYSCAFAALVRAIGLNCYAITGLTAKATGGMTEHAWCVINIDGIEYIFDSQIDDNIARDGDIGYYRFCKTYDEVPESYESAKINRYFKPF